MDVNAELTDQGLKPMSWEAVLQSVKARLSVPEWEQFSRLHRTFVAYGGEEALRRFYGFVFSHGLEKEVNAFRFHRLHAILSSAHPRLSPLAADGSGGLSVLDIGAGSGIIARILAARCRPGAYVVQDLCEEVRTHLAKEGFPVLPHPPPHPPDSTFELILCADSLGEINFDEDHWLADPKHSGHPDFQGILEARYGFAQKLEPWKPYLAPSGSLLLWEPFTQPHLWEALADLLREHGWKAELRKQGVDYVELSLG